MPYIVEFILASQLLRMLFGIVSAVLIAFGIKALLQRFLHMKKQSALGIGIVVAISWMFSVVFILGASSKYGLVEYPREVWGFEKSICVYDTLSEGGKYGSTTYSRVACYDKESGARLFRENIGVIAENPIRTQKGLYFVGVGSHLELHHIDVSDFSLKTILSNEQATRLPMMQSGIASMHVFGGNQAVSIISKSGDAIFLNPDTLQPISNDKPESKITKEKKSKPFYELQKEGLKFYITDKKAKHLLPDAFLTADVVGYSDEHDILLLTHTETIEKKSPRILTAVSLKEKKRLWDMHEKEIPFDDLMTFRSQRPPIRYCLMEGERAYLVSNGYIASINILSGKINWNKRM